jgi:hypothetical protein
MGGSITHPEPEARRAALGVFRAELVGALRDAAAATVDPGTAKSLGEFVGLAGSIDLDVAAPELVAPLDRLPVCSFWEQSLAAATGAPRGIVTSLRSLAASLSWAQNPNYRRSPPDATFLDNYGYAVLAGPEDGPPALATDPRLALGVLLLGPRAHYPLHAHPAVEIYYTLTPDGEWWRGDGPWRHEPPGAVIHHAPNVRHATRAGASPLLAIYLWRGDLATHAKLTQD